MDASNQPQKRTFLRRLPALSKSKALALVVVLVAVVAVGGWLLLSDNRVTAVPNGIWLSIDEVKKLPMSGPAWDNVKSVADRPLAKGVVGDQTSTHDTQTYANALVYARTGNETYRKKVADSVTSIINTESTSKREPGQDNRTLSLGWHLSAYVISADLINLPQYNPGQHTAFSNWLRTVRTKTLADDRTLIETHETRPNNWGTGAGASRVAADLYLGDRADLDKAAKVLKGFLGDRSSYSDFKYGELSWQCNPSQPVGVNPVGCNKSGMNIGGVIPDDMRRGGPIKNPPGTTDYPWTSLQGLTMQTGMLERHGYNTLSASNSALKRAVEYMYQLSRTQGSGWWAGADEAWVPWVVNSLYGAKYPTTSTPDSGRVSNFADWTHAQVSQQPVKDTTAPSVPTSIKSTGNIANNVQLSWGPSTDNVTVTGYEVSRDGAVLGFTTTTSYTDTTAAANKTYAYRVRAFDAAGNASQPANVSVVTISAQGDTVKPAAAITKPTENTTITTDSTPITFTATDNIKVTKIELYVDTQLDVTITDITKTTFSANWNTKASGNGKHTIQVKAYDAAGNQGASSTVSVTVAIPGGPPPPPPPPSGQVLTFNPVADARMSQGNATKNYGSEDFLRIRNSGGDSWKSILKFDVKGLTGAPRSAKLRLFATDGGPDAGTLFATSSSWNEGTVTWNTTPINANVYRVGKSTSVSVNDQSWAEWDMTAWIKSNSLFTYGLTGDDDNSVFYNSREGKNKPTLIIIK